DDKFITTDYLQQCRLMGHKSISSTEVYTKVFALDVAARHRVQFAMPEAEAVALIKKLTEVVNKNWPPR
ncbi:hypothetical protein CQA67_30090, partial [Klebsiella pneumoniae]